MGYGPSVVEEKVIGYPWRTVPRPSRTPISWSMCSTTQWWPLQVSFGSLFVLFNQYSGAGWGMGALRQDTKRLCFVGGLFLDVINGPLAEDLSGMPLWRDRFLIDRISSPSADESNNHRMSEAMEKVVRDHWAGWVPHIRCHFPTIPV